MLARSLSLAIQPAVRLAPVAALRAAHGCCMLAIETDRDESVVDGWKHDLPNALTMARVLAIPLLLGIFHRKQHTLVPAAIFFACAITDFFDGYLARRWNVFSDFGAFLDPVADKLLVCACLALLSGAFGAVVALPTAVIVCREVAVSALREWMGAQGAREAVAVGFAGKVKTTAQMAALQLLLLSLGMPAVAAVRTAGIWLLYVAAVLSCTSASGYFAVAMPLLKRK